MPRFHFILTPAPTGPRLETESQHALFFCQNRSGLFTVLCVEMRINCVLCGPPAVSCGMPAAPVNGGVLAPDYSAGTRATYFCNEGFRLSSKEVTSTVCQADGTWSSHNKIPRCTGETRQTLTSPHVHGFISTVVMCD